MNGKSLANILLPWLYIHSIVLLFVCAAASLGGRSLQLFAIFLLVREVGQVLPDLFEVIVLPQHNRRLVGRYVTADAWWVAWCAGVKEHDKLVKWNLIIITADFSELVLLHVNYWRSYLHVDSQLKLCRNYLNERVLADGAIFAWSTAKGLKRVDILVAFGNVAVHARKLSDLRYDFQQLLIVNLDVVLLHQVFVDLLHYRRSNLDTAG